MLDRIDIQADQPSTGCEHRQHFPRVSAKAERAIHRQIARPQREHFENFRHHNRPVAARRRLAGCDHLGHIGGITRGIVLLVFVFKPPRILARVTGTPPVGNRETRRGRRGFRVGHAVIDGPMKPTPAPKSYGENRSSPRAHRSNFRTHRDFANGCIVQTSPSSSATAILAGCQKMSADQRCNLPGGFLGADRSDFFIPDRRDPQGRKGAHTRTQRNRLPPITRSMIEAPCAPNVLVPENRATSLLHARSQTHAGSLPGNPPSTAVESTRAS